VEELTLHLIEQNKGLIEQNKKLEAQQNLISKQNDRILVLEKQ
jgi:hypothetical protein